MSWTNSLKLTLESNSVVAGLQRIMDVAGRTTSAVGGIAGAATRAGSSMLGAFKGASDILWKLPDQVRALRGAIEGLSLPSKLAGSAETTAVAFRVLVGDGEKAAELLDRIRTLANSTPFEFPELADAARKLSAFGESAETIPETLRRIGDVAAGTQASITELAFIYGKARVAGTLYAEDINQLLERGIPVLDLFAQQTGKSVAEVKKLASEGGVTFPMLEAAFRSLTGEGGKFAGMMGEISQTFEGKMSTLSDSFNGLMAALGKGVNEGLKPVLDELTKQLDGQQGLAKSIGEAIGNGLEVGMEMLKDGRLGEYLGAEMGAVGLELGAGMVEAAGKFLQTIKSGLEEMGVLGEGKAVRGTFGAGGFTADKPDPGMADTMREHARYKREEAAAAGAGARQRIAGRRAAAAAEAAQQQEAAYANGTANKTGAGSADAEAFNSYTGGAGGGTFQSTTVIPGMVPVDAAPGAAGGVAAPAGRGRTAAGYSGETRAEAMARYTAKAGAAAPAMRRAPVRSMNRAEFMRQHGDGGMRSQFRGLDSGYLYGGSAPAPARADRMAGMAGGPGAAAQSAAQTADMAMKAALMVVKHLPAIAESTKRTATNTGK